MFDLHDSAKKKDLENKTIFWDLDGTLAPWRFNGHIGDLEGSPHGMSMKEVEDGIYFERTPSKFMQRLVNDCNAKANIILTHCHCDREVQDKHRWLDKHFPIIKERFVIHESVPKTDTMLKYCEENKLNLRDIVFIDDSTYHLRQAEKAGIPCWHISSLLDYFENDN